jgi:hypothetical protein
MDGWMVSVYGQNRAALLPSPVAVSLLTFLDEDMNSKFTFHILSTDD